MKQERFSVGGVPAILWGERADGVYFYVHGQGGSKEEAASFAECAASRGWQVLSIDLPAHGERQNRAGALDPWHAVPELEQLLAYAGPRWSRLALFANSIGAWFSMLALQDAALENCLFVSPILDMERLIRNMMGWAHVTEAQLLERQTIETDFGQTLSWEYFCWAKAHPIVKWNAPTRILYAGRDNLTERGVAEEFTRRFGCRLTIMEDGEHWFHTPEQLAVLEQWIKDSL